MDEDVRRYRIFLEVEVEVREAPVVDEHLQNGSQSTSSQIASGPQGHVTGRGA